MADTPAAMMPPETVAERAEADARLWRLACAEQREACAQLAEQHRVTYQVRCKDGVDCPGHELAGGHTHHGVPFADLIRARTQPPPPPATPERNAP